MNKKVCTIKRTDPFRALILSVSELYLFVSLLWFRVVYAGEVFTTGDSLTALFKTRGFMGNAQILSKLNWVSALVSDIISVACFIGLALTVIRIIMTMLYLSNRNVFDNIHALKSSNSANLPGGLSRLAPVIGPVIGPSMAGWQKAGGLDVIVQFILGLLPDVKMYSDMNDEASHGLPGNLKEDDSITQYILKISLSTIMSIFFFTIGWNGVLWQAYGSVVDALGVAAERMVNDDFQNVVANALNTGKYYSFGFDLDGTEQGKFKQHLAKDMYNKAVLKLDSAHRGQENMQVLGKHIENFINSNLDDAAILQVANNGGTYTTDSSVSTTDDQTRNYVSGLPSGEVIQADKFEYLGPGTKYVVNGTVVNYRSKFKFTGSNATYEVVYEKAYDPNDKDSFDFSGGGNKCAYYKLSSVGSTTGISDSSWANVACTPVIRYTEPNFTKGAIDPNSGAYVDWIVLDELSGGNFVWKAPSRDSSVYLLVMIHRTSKAGNVNYYEKVNDRSWTRDEEDTTVSNSNK